MNTIGLQSIVFIQHLKHTLAEGNTVRKVDFDALEAADRIAGLSDDVLLTVSEAAIYLRLSKSQLDKLRRTPGKNGPQFIQSAQKKTTDGFHKVFYRLGDLRAWRNAQKTTCSWARDCEID